ncbi:hypothetical protein V6N13_095349 [Hibiscus sabdariffa]
MVHSIDEVLNRPWCVRFSHIARDGNHAADWMAKLASSDDLLCHRDKKSNTIVQGEHWTGERELNSRVFGPRSQKLRPKSSILPLLVSAEQRRRRRMEGITEGVNNLNITDSSASNNKKNRIQVSNTKKPLFFYVNLAKRYMQQYNEVELSALGMAIATVVTIAEILKNNGLAVEKKITTSTVDMREEYGGRPIQKAKIEIVLGKSEKFDELMEAAAEDVIDNDGQS